jgi:hypothetical protein
MKGWHTHAPIGKNPFYFIRSGRGLVAWRKLLKAPRAVPNPGSRNEWTVHGQGGMHDVWPFKFETEFLNVIVLAIASQSPHKYSKTAKQHY